MNEYKEIGGFFELSITAEYEEYHPTALKLNSARNCLKYILQANRPSKVYLPAYCCDSLIEPLITENVDYEFYSINEVFEPVDLPTLQLDEHYLYINYFGLKREFIGKLHNVYDNNLIIDNTQAFFEKPLDDVDTFYSARKFFGVPDGGYLYTSAMINNSLEVDISFDRMRHILGRYELNASTFYNDFRESETGLVDQSVKKMSKLTADLMTTFNYEEISKQRKENFRYLAESLNSQNLIDVDIDNGMTPMIYPFLIKRNIKQKLIENGIYVATYWQDAIKRVNEHSDEKLFIDYLVPLPIDQRYSVVDMERIVKVIKEW